MGGNPFMLLLPRISLVCQFPLLIRTAPTHWRGLPLSVSPCPPHTMLIPEYTWEAPKRDGNQQTQSQEDKYSRIPLV